MKRSQPSHRGGDSAVLSARTGPRTRVDADARRTVACCGDEYRRHISEEAPTDHVRVEHALSRVDEFSVRCAVHDREPTRELRLTLQQRWRPERQGFTGHQRFQPRIMLTHSSSRRWLQAIWQWLSRSGRQVDPVDVQVPWIDQRREPDPRVSGIGVQREPLTSSVGQGDCYA
jgi:hypothetical protein